MAKTEPSLNLPPRLASAGRIIPTPNFRPVHLYSRNTQSYQFVDTPFGRRINKGASIFPLRWTYPGNSRSVYRRDADEPLASVAPPVRIASGRPAMTLTAWLAFATASTVLLMIPGPTVLLVVSYALTQGRRVALATAVGVALGDFTAMTLSLAGLGAILLASATLFTLLKWIGAAYLVYLGIRLWRAEPVLPQVEVTPRLGEVRRVLVHAFVVTALNPKSIAFFVAFVPQFIDRQAALLPQLFLMETTFVFLATLNALLFAFAADTLRSRIRRAGVLKWLNRAGASCLVGMGVATATLSRN